MRSALHRRLDRLSESIHQRHGAVHVVTGYSADDFKGEISALLRAKQARETDLFICVKRYWNGPEGVSP